MRLFTIIAMALCLVLPVWSDADGPASDTTKAWFPGSGYTLDSNSRLQQVGTQAAYNLNMAHYVIGSASAYGLLDKQIAIIPGSVTSGTIATVDLVTTLAPFDCAGNDYLTVQLYGESASGTIFTTTTGTIPTIDVKGTIFNRRYGDDLNLPSPTVVDATNRIQMGLNKIDTHGLSYIVMSVSASPSIQATYGTTGYYPMPVTYHILIGKPLEN